MWLFSLKYRTLKVEMLDMLMWFNVYFFLTSSTNCVRVLTLLTMKFFVLLLMKVVPSLVLQIWLL